MSLHTDTLYWFRNVEFWEISILIELVVINNAGLFYITLKWDHLNNSSVMLGLIWPCGVREIDFWNLFLLNKSNLKINITNLTIKKKKKYMCFTIFHLLGFLNNFHNLYKFPLFRPPTSCLPTQFFPLQRSFLSS
jgi:hypothetical protein